MRALWVQGKTEDVLAVGGGGGEGGWRGWSCWAAVEHYVSLGGEEGMWAVGAVGVGTLLWAVSAVKAQNQTKQEGAPLSADPGVVGGLSSLTATKMFGSIPCFAFGLLLLDCAKQGPCIPQDHCISQAGNNIDVRQSDC